jgi:hypothetical protein
MLPASATVLGHANPPSRDGTRGGVPIGLPDASAPQPKWASARTLFRETPWLTDAHHKGEL